MTGSERVGACVLLVDDEAGVLEVMKLYLEGLGHEVLVAGTPSAALDLVEKEGARITLLLTDVVMPEMSGVEMASKVREKRPKLPVLFFSAHTEGVISGGVRTRFLHKPFSHGRLEEVLDDLLANVQQVQERS